MRGLRRRILAVGLVAVAVSAAVACGGGTAADDGGTGSSPSPSASAGWSVVPLGERSTPTAGSLAAYGGTCWASTFAGVWRSVDGGSSWEHLSDDRYYDLCFTSARRGWAVGKDGLCATADGGATWTPVAVADAPRDLLTVRFLDGLRGALTGGQYGARYGGWVFTTADGGVSWEGARLTDGKLKGVCFANAREGWAVGDMDIVHTSDGGRSWTVQLHRDNGGLALSDAVCSADARRCWAVSALDGGIWKTDDGGENWRRVSGDWGGGIGGIAFATDEVGYAVGIVYPPDDSDDAAATSSGLLLSTTDGGDTWLEERVGAIGGLDDLCLPGDGRLVVLGDGLVLVRPL